MISGVSGGVVDEFASWVLTHSAAARFAYLLDVKKPFKNAKGLVRCADDKIEFAALQIKLETLTEKSERLEAEILVQRTTRAEQLRKLDIV